jgi:hypothetical protein
VQRTVKDTRTIMIRLGFFAGFLFYVGAFDILPHAMRAAG